MENMAVNVRRYLIISSILALAASAAGCGSGGGRPGANGGSTGPETTASGGTLANGGTPGNGGATANGGTTGTSTAPNCATAFTPSPALITDFSSGPAGWHAAIGGGKWGTVGAFTGSIFGFAGTNSTMAASVDQTNQYMLLAGNVAAGDYAGGGLSFDQCVNTTTYTGVQFTLGGTPAGCDVYFYAQTFDEKMPGSGQIGGCTSGCYAFPGTKLASASGVMSVPFSALSGGVLTTAPAISNEMVGLQWQLNSPAADGGNLACTGIALTVTNVSFVP